MPTPRNIVVCCDGTGNQVGRNISNVLKLFRVLQRDELQRVYYSPGVGTIGGDDPWSRLKQDANAIFGLATGRGLNDEILGAYRFICQHYDEDTQIFLFGFSRGAYAARAVAGLIHLIGLLSPDQLNIADAALAAYGRANESNDLTIAWNFSRITAARPVPINFVGVWDTVSSVIVPRRNRVLPSLQMLPYTRRNPSVCVFRHAMAIDERRRMFRLNRWASPQPFEPRRFATEQSGIAQDIRQVWFAGVHSDVGGGYPETQSGLSKYPLKWMINEARNAGLLINSQAVRVIVDGKPIFGKPNPYVKPDSGAMIHNSLTKGWWPLEWVPKRVRWREWPGRSYAGWYVPDGEPRNIGPGDDGTLPLVHQSAVDRRNASAGYSPINFPTLFDIEPY